MGRIGWIVAAAPAGHAGSDASLTLAGWSQKLSGLPAIAVGSVTATHTMPETRDGMTDVVADPAPSVVFDNFGESTFDFSLYCFVADRSQVIATRSALRYAIVETFDQQGVEMPFRQLDVHLRSGWSNPKDQPQPEG